MTRRLPVREHLRPKPPQFGKPSEASRLRLAELLGIDPDHEFLRDYVLVYVNDADGRSFTSMPVDIAEALPCGGQA